MNWHNDLVGKGPKNSEKDTDNLRGGAGSGGYTPYYSQTADNYGGNGGSGIVIISYSTGS